MLSKGCHPTGVSLGMRPLCSVDPSGIKQAAFLLLFFFFSFLPFLPSFLFSFTFFSRIVSLPYLTQLIDCGCLRGPREAWRRWWKTSDCSEHLGVKCTAVFGDCAIGLLSVCLPHLWYLSKEKFKKEKKKRKK